MVYDLDATFYRPVPVALPREDSTPGLNRQPPGTAFVIAATGEVEERRRIIYYEEPGESSNVRTFADRALIAHGRAWSDLGGDPPRHQASTHKLLAIETAAILTLGSYDPREGTITLDNDPEIHRRLPGWLGLSDAENLETALEAELLTTSVNHETRRRWRRALAANPALRGQPSVRTYVRRHGHGDLLGDLSQQP
jgi:hypothetical protein